MAAVREEKELLLISLENPSQHVLFSLANVLAPYTLLTIHSKVGGPNTFSSLVASPLPDRFSPYHSLRSRRA